MTDEEKIRLAKIIVALNGGIWAGVSGNLDPHDYDCTQSSFRLFVRNGIYYLPYTQNLDHFTDSHNNYEEEEFLFKGGDKNENNHQTKR